MKQTMIDIKQTTKSMSKKKFITLAALAILLGACGGGGGGDGGGDPNPPQPPPVNRAPSISGQAPLAIEVGEMYIFTPSTSDPDGDNLSFSVENIADWMSFDSSTGEISGMPNSTQLGDVSNILISVSDGSLTSSLTPFTVSVNPARVSTEDVVSSGPQNPIPEDDLSEDAASGYTTQGDVELNIAGETVNIEDADLRVEFDADENLVSLVGEGILPDEVGDNFAINTRTKVRMGLYKGDELNQDPDIDILLKDDFYYLIYYTGISTDVTLGDRKGGPGESITLSTPASGEILFVTDPTDSFYYYYANTPIGIQGVGESDQGFIPYQAIQPSPFLDSFEGHEIYKAGTSLGVKVFDFFKIVGDRIVRNPLFDDIDWDDPLNSPIEFKAGFNGTADFALSVFNVGLFEFPVAAASATIDVGFDRQQMAMQTTLAPDVSWQPDWFTILPETEVVGEWMINGDETFVATLSGSYKSTLPEASMKGSIKIDNDGATLQAKIPDAEVPLEVSAEFANSQTIYKILAEIDISESVTDSVNKAFDKEIEDKLAALEDLEKKTEDYEFEVSLRGLRESLPTIADGAIAQINAIPGSVNSSVYSNVRSEINARRFCTFAGCVPNNNARDNLARTSATSAERIARTQIKASLDAMVELKFRAQQEDDAAFRQALEDALYEAYNHRVVSGRISVKVDLPSPVDDYTHVHNYSKTVLSNDTSARILSAAQNAFKIQETSDIRIEASEIYERIPTEEAVEAARADLAAGLTAIPSFQGAGMTVAGNSFSAFVILSNEQQAVEFNVLDPVDLLIGLGEIASEQLIIESNPD